MLNLQLIKLRQKIHLLFFRRKAPNNTNNDVTTKPSTSEIQTKPTTPQESTNMKFTTATNAFKSRQSSYRCN